MGVKPLYFGWDGNSLCFGSELKALRAYEHWRPDIDMQSLGEYLRKDLPYLSQAGSEPT
jgi:asparagine synthase (glutamine-hydrolysing)